VFGGGDFFAGESSSGVVTPIDPAEEGDAEPADELAGGDDFFGGANDGVGAGNGGDDGGGLTPEQLAELDAINAETADAIIDNIDG
jgi:hypothetical protein